ncbi:hypothetical protein MMC10_005633 [Thelotrema lepadinum]|nr:hypothetical protein [Thelotrema lepadinum]
MDRNTQRHLNSITGELNGQLFSDQVFQTIQTAQGSATALRAVVPSARPVHTGFVARNPYSNFDIPRQNPVRPGNFAGQPFVSGNFQTNHFLIHGVHDPPGNNSFNNPGYPNVYQPHPELFPHHGAQVQSGFRPGAAVPRDLQGTGTYCRRGGWNGAASLPIDSTEDNAHGSLNIRSPNIVLPPGVSSATSPQPTGAQRVQPSRIEYDGAASDEVSEQESTREEAEGSQDGWDEFEKLATEEEPSSNRNPTQSPPLDSTRERPVTGDSTGEDGQANGGDGKPKKGKRMPGEKRRDKYALGNPSQIERMQSATRLFLGSSSKVPAISPNFKNEGEGMDRDRSRAETLGAAQIIQAVKHVATHGEINEATMKFRNSLWGTEITAPELTETAKRMLELEAKKKHADEGVLAIEPGPIDRVFELRQKMGKEDLFRDLWKEVRDDHSNGYFRHVWMQMSTEDRQLTMVLNAYQTLDSHGLLKDEEVDEVQAHASKWHMRTRAPDWTGPKVDFAELARREAEKQAEAAEAAEAAKAEEEATPKQVAKKPRKKQEQKNRASRIDLMPSMPSSAPKPLKRKKKATQNAASQGTKSANAGVSPPLDDENLTARDAEGELDEDRAEPGAVRQPNGKFSWETAYLKTSAKTDQPDPEASGAGRDPTTGKNVSRKDLLGEDNVEDEGMVPQASPKKGSPLKRPSGYGAGSRGGRGGRKKAEKKQDKDNGELLGVKDGEAPHKVTKTQGRGRGRGRGGNGGGTKGTTKRMTKKQKEAAAAAAAEDEEAALAEAEATLLAEMDMEFEDDNEDSLATDTPGTVPTVANTPDTTFTEDDPLHPSEKAHSSIEESNADETIPEGSAQTSAADATLLEPEQSLDASTSEESDDDDDDPVSSITPVFELPGFQLPAIQSPTFEPPAFISPSLQLQTSHSPTPDPPTRPKRPTTRRTQIDPYASITATTTKATASEIANKASEWEAKEKEAQLYAKRIEEEKRVEAAKAKDEEYKKMHQEKMLVDLEGAEKREEREIKRQKRAGEKKKKRKREVMEEVTEEMKFEEARKKLFREYGVAE